MKIPFALLLQAATDVPARLNALEAAAKSAQSAGDNAWMLTSAALVLMMTGPGLALFYGGLVRQKECAGHHDAQFHHDGPGDGDLGASWVTVWFSAKARRLSAD